MFLAELSLKGVGMEESDWESNGNKIMGFPEKADNVAL